MAPLPDMLAAAGHALLSGLLIAARWFAPGMTWGWVLKAGRPPSPPAGTDRAQSAARSLITGIASSLLVTWALGALGICSAAIEWMCLAGWTILGGLLGLTFRPRDCASQVASSRTAFFLFALAAALLLALPNRGEWILGGWDPGVYVNHGIHLARTGAYGAWPSDILSRLSDDGMALLTRRFGRDYVEMFPGCPVSIADHAFRPFFFPLTPAAIAALERCGGLGAAVRMGHIIGLATTVLFAAWLLTASRRRLYAAAGAILLAMQPIFIHHLRTPASEMLELFFVCATAWLLANRRDSAGSAIGLGLVFFAATLNRISFVAWAAAVMLLLAILDFRRDDRFRVWIERGFLILSTAAAAAVDMRTAGIVPRLGHVMPRLIGLAAVGIAVALLTDALAPVLISSYRQGRRRFRRWATAAAGFAALALIFALVSAGSRPWHDAARTISRLMPFIGWPMLGLALAGATAIACGVRRGLRISPEVWGFAACLTAVVLALLPRQYVAELYPWATKRFLADLTPLLALCGAAVPVALWELRMNRPRLALFGAALGAGALTAMAPARWEAWRRTEYDGASAALAQAASRIKPEDVVVADHFWWATPLTFIHGLQALDGSPAWAGENILGGSRLRALCEHLSAQGCRVRFLTSTKEGIGIYPVRMGTLSEDWHSEAFVLREIVHRPVSRGFETRPRLFEFRLYTWEPDHAAANR